MNITQLVRLSSITFLISTAACSKILGSDASEKSVTNPETAGQTTEVSTHLNSIRLVEAESQSSQPAEESERSQHLIAQLIQTQPGPEGSEVDLTSAKVTGQILTVTLNYRKMPDFNLAVSNSYPIEEVSYIDDATSKQYGVLQDQSGSWLASPKHVDEEQISIFLADKKSQIAWFKFPAPPPEAQTISINIPEVAPFDGVRIER